MFVEPNQQTRHNPSLMCLIALLVLSYQAYTSFAGQDSPAALSDSKPVREMRNLKVPQKETNRVSPNPESPSWGRQEDTNKTLDGRTRNEKSMQS